MGDDAQPVHRIHPGALAVRQTQAPAKGLLHQGFGIGGAQGHDGVEVGHIPALLEHIDVDNDFRGFVEAFHRQQAADHFFLSRAAAAAVHLDHLALVAAIKELIFQLVQQLGGVGRVAGNHQHKGLHRLYAMLAGIGEQLHLGGLVQANAIFQLDALQLFGGVLAGFEV